MPKITIVRPNEWANQAKHINIYIDGENAGRIGINQIAHFNLSTGKHKVELRNRWCGGSKPLTVVLRENENKIFEISSNQYTFLIASILFVIASTLYHGAVSILALDPSFLYDLLGLGLVFMSLFIPFYSRYYMTLKEVDTDVFKKATKEKRMPMIKNAMKCDEKEVCSKLSNEQ